MMDQMTAPAPDTGAQTDDSSVTQGYTIEISVAGDGSITVGAESAAQENAEGGSGVPSGGASSDSSEGTAQPAKNIKDALLMALEIFKAGGEMPKADTSDADFSQGYTGSQA